MVLTAGFTFVFLDFKTPQPSMPPPPATRAGTPTPVAHIVEQITEGRH